MIYEEIMLREQMFNKIEDNSTVAIFGACPAGKCILEDIKKYKKNVKVVSFIDNFVKGTFENLPVYNLKEYIDKKITCDTVIMSTLNKIYASIHILRMYKYNVLEQTRFIYIYYRFKFCCSQRIVSVNRFCTCCTMLALKIAPVSQRNLNAFKFRAIFLFLLFDIHKHSKLF